MPGGGNVLVEGETGTGKELVARAIHDCSSRARETFAPVNCGALPQSLLESELFGHARGAFTGADAAREGVFELANRGTLFLDEVSTLPLALQPALLRVLDSGEVRRVGESKARHVDVRIVAATNVSLADAARAGEFRQDLLFRLNTFRIGLPPLRERGDDILLLADHFLSGTRRAECHAWFGRASGAAVARLARKRPRASPCHASRRGVRR